LYSNIANAVVNDDDWVAALGKMYDSDGGRGLVGDVGELVVDEDEERWSGCFWNHLAQLPESAPRHAPIHGCPTPKRFPLQLISKGNFTPR